MSVRESHISETNFRRYLNNEMLETERNAFEKELHRNPFEAEALEGFEAVSSANFQNDLNEIKKKLKFQKRKNKYHYLAAATILLIITAGVIWIQLKKR